MEELFVIDNISCNTELDDEGLVLRYWYRFLNLNNGKEMVLDIRKIKDFDNNEYTLYDFLGNNRTNTIKKVIKNGLVSNPNLFNEIQ